MIWYDKKYVTFIEKFTGKLLQLPDNNIQLNWDKEE